MSEFPNLIGEANVSVLLGDIKPHPLNWRTHSPQQMEATKQSIERGTAGNVLVNKRSGHIINGHMRYALAQAEGHATIVVDYVDVDEETEKRLLATLDSVALLSDIEPVALGTLVDGLDLGSVDLDILIEGLIGDIPDAGGETAFRQDRLYSENRPSLRDGPGDLPLEPSSGHVHRWICADCGAEHE